MLENTMDDRRIFVYVSTMDGFYNQPASLEVFHYPYLSGWVVPMRRHPCWQFYWNRSDAATICLENGESFRVDPSMYYIIPRNTRYSGHADKPFQHCYMHFHLSWPGEPGVHAFPMTPDLRKLLERVFKSCPDNESSSLKVLLGHQILYRALEPYDFSEVQLHPDEPRIEPAMHHLITHLKNGCSNAELAQICSMGINNFLRLFKEIYGTTPQHYATIKRCEHVAMHLQRNIESLDWIADTAGFCDRYHMTKVFTKERGIAPAAFRKQSRLAQRPQNLKDNLINSTKNNQTSHDSSI